MASFAKWLGGGLGFVVAGPIGGLLGFIMGSVVDSATIIGSAQINGTGRTSQGDFGMSLLVLVAAVMKADGKVLKSELDYVKIFFVRQFGQEASNQALMMLRDLIKQDIPVKDVSEQIRRNMDYSSRLQLMHLLFNISMADNHAHPTEVVLIGKISEYMGIASSDFISIKNMFIPETDSSYKILEADPSSTNEDLKKAYRRMAMKYHPDKVSHLGEEFRKTAESKFKKVNEAYEKIKKERNIV